MYILPASSPPRTKNKWGLGALPAANGGARSNIMLWRPPIPILPGPMPVWPGGGRGGGSVGIRPTPHCQPGDAAMANATWDPVKCQWVPDPLPIIIPPVPPVKSTGGTAGTPVPAGFPTNQFFVAPDGSVWEYSTASNSWFNTGTPYSTGSSGGGATSGTPAAVSTSGAAQPPVSVTVAPATSSGYQAILDWLTQQTLISSIPNWVVGSGVALLGWKLFGSGGKR